jgi:phosphoketolase
LVHRHPEFHTPEAAKYIEASPNPQNPETWERRSAMEAVDTGFLAATQANPHLRPRVGNPDEMKSNRMLKTLEALKFRVTDPEPGIPEDIHGAVVTALNEEAVAGAALGNKAGINIAVTYEAFGIKMHGIFRQEITWIAQSIRAGEPPGWISIALVLTSHTWENAKNEHSHQDPSIAEALLGEHSNVSRVLFAADYNSAAAIMRELYGTRGQIWTLVVPKAQVASILNAGQAEALVRDGAVLLHEMNDPKVILTAIGSYQLQEALRASQRLAERGVAHNLVYMQEPGRFRAPRTRFEQEHLARKDVVSRLYPAVVRSRLFVVHTRPEPMRGVVAPLDTGSETEMLGYINHGGTLNTNGMLFVNRSTWAHCVDGSARLAGVPRTQVLGEYEMKAIDHRADPNKLIGME